MLCSLDFEVERRSLWQTVLPELQLRFIPQGIDVQLVDMQHGSRVDHVYDRQTFDRHLAEIDACHSSSLGPFFLVSNSSVSHEFVDSNHHHH